MILESPVLVPGVVAPRRRVARDALLEGRLRPPVSRCLCSGLWDNHPPFEHSPYHLPNRQGARAAGSAAAETENSSKAVQAKVAEAVLLDLRRDVPRPGLASPPVNPLPDQVWRPGRQAPHRCSDAEVQPGNHARSRRLTPSSRGATDRAIRMAACRVSRYGPRRPGEGELKHDAAQVHVAQL